jgi:hypothetical protein
MSCSKYSNKATEFRGWAGTRPLFSRTILRSSRCRFSSNRDEICKKWERFRWRDNRRHIERRAKAAPAQDIVSGIKPTHRNDKHNKKRALSLLLVSVSEVIELLGPSLRSFKKSTPPTSERQLMRWYTDNVQRTTFQHFNEFDRKEKLSLCNIDGLA